jgi:hypothetical protein
LKLERWYVVDLGKKIGTGVEPKPIVAPNITIPDVKAPGLPVREPELVPVRVRVPQ